MGKRLARQEAWEHKTTAGVGGLVTPTTDKRLGHKGSGRCKARASCPTLLCPRREHALLHDACMHRGQGQETLLAAAETMATAAAAASPRPSLGRSHPLALPPARLTVGGMTQPSSWASCAQACEQGKEGAGAGPTRTTIMQREAVVGGGVQPARPSHGEALVDHRRIAVQAVRCGVVCDAAPAPAPPPPPAPVRPASSGPP